MFCPLSVVYKFTDLSSSIAQEELDSYRRATSLYNDEKQSAFEEHRKTVQRLTSIEAELAKYQSIYGSSSLSAESSALVEQLQRKEEDIKRLRLEASQRAEVRIYFLHCQMACSFKSGRVVFVCGTW